MVPAVSVNILAVIVAAAAVQVLGMVWFSKPVFGTLWLQLGKFKPADMKNPALPFVVSIVTSLLTAYILAHFVAYTGVADLTGAFTLAFWLWLGFEAGPTLMHMMFEVKPFMLFLIHAGFDLASLLLMAGILTLWK
jgi:hypothetical protein